MQDDGVWAWVTDRQAPIVAAAFGYARPPTKTACLYSNFV